MQVNIDNNGKIIVLEIKESLVADNSILQDFIQTHSQDGTIYTRDFNRIVEEIESLGLIYEIKGGL